MYFLVHEGVVVVVVPLVVLGVVLTAVVPWFTTSHSELSIRSRGLNFFRWKWWEVSISPDF